MSEGRIFAWTDWTDCKSVLRVLAWADTYHFIRLDGFSDQFRLDGFSDQFRLDGFAIRPQRISTFLMQKKKQ